MLTVLLRGHVEKIRPFVNEHLPGARMKYNKAKDMTAIQHDELTRMGREGVETIARVQGLPYVTCVNIKPFAAVG